MSTHEPPMPPVTDAEHANLDIDPAIVPPPGRLHGALVGKVTGVTAARPIMLFGGLFLLAVVGAAVVWGLSTNHDSKPPTSGPPSAVNSEYLVPPAPDASPQILPNNAHNRPPVAVAHAPRPAPVVIPRVDMPADLAHSQTATQPSAQQLAQATALAAAHVAPMTVSLSGQLPAASPNAAVPPGDTSSSSDAIADQVRRPTSPFEVMAGTIIPATLLSGIDSSVPGEVLAQVRQPVFDTPTGQLLLVPAGTRLVGTYEQATSPVQGRVLLVWQRMIFPDGQSLRLENMAAADAQGYTGIPAKVDSHRGKTVGNVMLLTLLGVGAQLSQPASSGSIYYQSAPTAGQVAAGQLGQQLNNLAVSQTNKVVDLPPTLHVKPGAAFNVVVSRDLVFPGVYDDRETTQ